MATALFVCLHNAGRSQMSAALFEQTAAGRHRGLSAGTTPAERVHPEVVTVMRELGIDLADRSPQLLTRELAEQADVIVTMGCGDACPAIPGTRSVDWQLPDPKGRPLDEVRATRDAIAEHVRALADELDSAALSVSLPFRPMADDAPNIHQPRLQPWEAPAGYGSLRARIGYDLDSELIGVSQWVLPPGEAAYPYHFHYSDEEIVIVLDGRPTLRTPDGLRELASGEAVRFPVGEAGAHQLRNDTDEPASFLSISSSGRPDIVHYVDSDKIGVGERRPRGGGLRQFFPREAAVDYWDGEPPPTRPVTPPAGD
jgi:protein-tyrosine-phosphatase/uncharacterized cupin superfamily protein